MNWVGVIIDLVKSMIPAITGWVMAKRGSKIDELEAENEKLKKYQEIESAKVIQKEMYDGKWD